LRDGLPVKGGSGADKQCCYLRNGTGRVPPVPKDPSACTMASRAVHDLARLRHDEYKYGLFMFC
jgi:hypothetical protein